tara:strand:+ start:414 stop:680 length:267 start_codon:yes stop_codon:yes gene_type:complete
MQNLIRLNSKLRQKGAILAKDLYAELLQECLVELGNDLDVVNMSAKANGEAHGFGEKMVDENAAREFLLFVITELRQLIVEETNKYQK